MHRDLACHDPWEESLRRSRARREAAASARRELPTRELSIAAVVALTGVPIAGATVAKALGGGENHPAASAPHPSAKRVVAAVPLRPKPAAAPKAPIATAANPAVAAQPKPQPAPTPAPTDLEAPRSPAATLKRQHAATSKEQAQPQAVTASAAAKAKPAVVTPTGKHRPAGVAALQRALHLNADGDFGPATEKALKHWQKRHGLAADGVAGARTRSVLGLPAGKALERAHVKRAHRSHAKRHHAVARHHRGGGVAALQRALGLSADGVFGPATEKALKRWQRAHGLAADGVAGPQTRAKLGLGRGPTLKPKHAGHRRGHGGGGGGSSSVVARVIAAGNRIATTPYIYGGGHGSFTASGYDCSGSVSYALHGGGLLSSPLDSSAFMSYGRSGPGKHITIYANSGHVFMVVDGRRFDTSARSSSGSRWSSSMRSTSGYVARHPAGY